MRAEDSVSVVRLEKFAYAQAKTDELTWTCE
jgi:hypothetical protein